MSNGKEDACIDVQHKKRGRPRLRDDRDAKFDGSRFGSSGDAMRRPMPVSTAYGQRSSMGMAHDDNLRRTQSYRILKSQPAEPIAPRFPERALASDANIFPAPLSIPPRAPEPAAYLTVDFEFGNASTAFLDSIARQSVKGLRLADVVVAGDRERASALHRQIQDERQRKDPTYLPPMFSRENADRVMQSLGFSSEELSRYAPEWQEHLSFMGHDGQVRQLSFRMGLTKVDSIYLVVLWLTPIRAFQYPTPSPNPREITYSYPPAQQGYSQPTPVSATFDARHSRPGDGGYGPRQGGPLMAAGLSPGMQSSYAASPNRPEYSMHQSYQAPRGELATGGRPSQGPGFQLPPIRNQQPSPTQPQESSYPSREERSRVDIGGLLDRPGPSNKPRQP